MGADTPHQSSELLLTPLQGALVGLVAAFPMLGVVLVLEPGSGASARAWLVWLGGLVGRSPLATGLVLHGLIGACLGTLYAMSQERISRPALLGVGLFYGLVLWIGGRILFGWLFSTPVRDVVMSWRWLAGSLSFGFLLAAAAGWAGARR